MCPQGWRGAKPGVQGSRQVHDPQDLNPAPGSLTCYQATGRTWNVAAIPGPRPGDTVTKVATLELLLSLRPSALSAPHLCTGLWPWPRKAPDLPEVPGLPQAGPQKNPCSQFVLKKIKMQLHYCNQIRQNTCHAGLLRGGLESR